MLYVCCLNDKKCINQSYQLSMNIFIISLYLLDQHVSMIIFFVFIFCSYQKTRLIAKQPLKPAQKNCQHQIATKPSFDEGHAGIIVDAPKKVSSLKY